MGFTFLSHITATAAAAAVSHNFTFNFKILKICDKAIHTYTSTAGIVFVLNKTQMEIYVAILIYY